MHSPHRLGNDALPRHLHELVAVHNLLNRFGCNRFGCRWVRRRGRGGPLNLLLFYFQDGFWQRNDGSQRPQRPHNSLQNDTTAAGPAGRGGGWKGRQNQARARGCAAAAQTAVWFAGSLPAQPGPGNCCARAAPRPWGWAQASGSWARCASHAPTPPRIRASPPSAHPPCPPFSESRPVPGASPPLTPVPPRNAPAP